jgi:hypothetical protein
LIYTIGKKNYRQDPKESIDEGDTLFYSAEKILAHIEDMIKEDGGVSQIEESKGLPICPSKL